MFGLGIPELLIILVIVFFIFGPKRLKNIGSDLGNAIKGFRTAVAEDEKKDDANQARVIEGESQASDRSAEKNTSGAAQDNKV